MAVIKSGASATNLTVDTASLAARMSPYDVAGNALYPSYSGTYITRIEAVPATTLTDGTTYWSMRNTGAKTCFIRTILLMLAFSGTAAASMSKFQMGRISAATPTGGTALTVIKRDAASATSSVTDVRTLATGLTTTGVTFEPTTYPIIFGIANQLTAQLSQEIDFANGGEEGRFRLASGDGLSIRAYGTVVAGINISGAIWWDER